MANEVYEKWLEYYDNNGLSWLATQVQASIKQAFFAGYEAAEQGVQLTGLSPTFQLRCVHGYVACGDCGTAKSPRN